MFSQIVLSCLVTIAVSFPHTGLVNQGPQSGPLTPAYGDLVQTPKGLRSIALEGFSEDLDQDGYVDPVGQATAPVAVAQPIAPLAHAHAAPVNAYAAAPAVAYNYANSLVASAPAVAYNYAAPLAASAPAAIAAAPSVAYNYAAPVAAAVHSHAPAVHAVAPAETVHIQAAHHHNHGACVNNFGAIVPCAL
jgi:hypothetical protein